MTDDWKIAEKYLADGQVAIVYPLTYGRARLGVGPLDLPVFHNEW